MKPWFLGIVANECRLRTDHQRPRRQLTDDFAGIDDRGRREDPTRRRSGRSGRPNRRQVFRISDMARQGYVHHVMRFVAEIIFAT